MQLSDHSRVAHTVPNLVGFTYSQSGDLSRTNRCACNLLGTESLRISLRELPF